MHASASHAPVDHRPGPSSTPPSTRTFVHSPYSFQAYEEVPPAGAQGLLAPWCDLRSRESSGDYSAESASTDPVPAWEAADDPCGTPPPAPRPSQEATAGAPSFSIAAVPAPAEGALLAPVARPARRRPAAVQWRRYGTQVSPHEAMRQLRAFGAPAAPPIPHIRVACRPPLAAGAPPPPCPPSLFPS
eukprot:EG_transcript_9726